MILGLMLLFDNNLNLLFSLFKCFDESIHSNACELNILFIELIAADSICDREGKFLLP
jgi:hypothetical protein